jgi:hypothetical protein
MSITPDNMIDFYKNLKEYYGAKDTTVNGIKALTSPWDNENKTFIFILGTGNVRYGASKSKSMRMSDTMIKSIIRRDVSRPTDSQVR